MEQQISAIIDEEVKAIYRLEISKIDAKFIELLDALDEYLKSNMQLKIDSILLKMQEAYIQKDYVRFADIILYDLKPVVLN